MGCGEDQPSYGNWGGYGIRLVMFLRTIERQKNGKMHRYWSVVENRRVGGKRIVQKMASSPGVV